MLRAKHLGTISLSAGSFYLSGSRCSAGDVGLCNSSEDETCISQKSFRANVQQLQKLPLLLSNAQIAQFPDFSRFRPELNGKRPASESYAVNYAEDLDQKNILLSSPPIANQFVNGCMEAVGILFDLVNYRIPGVRS